MPPSLLRLSEIWTHASVTMMKIYCMYMTSILWYDLREYVCYCSCGCVYPLHCSPDPVLLCIMNYLLCMTHGLATAHLHDCAWTAIWAENICTSEHANVTMKLRCDGRQHGRRGSLHTTKVKWKIYPTSCTLLDVGFVFILRRTDIFILIWACTAVLPNITTVIFQIIRALN